MNGRKKMLLLNVLAEDTPVKCAIRLKADTAKGRNFAIVEQTAIAAAAVLAGMIRCGGGPFFRTVYAATEYRRSISLSVL